MSAFSEDEVLTMLGSVFRIKEVDLGENQIWYVKMNLCSQNDTHLQATFFHRKNQYGSNNTKLLLLANVLIDMADFNHAENFLLRLIKELLSLHPDIYKCYQALGKVSFEKGNYSRDLDCLRKSLQI